MESEIQAILAGSDPSAVKSFFAFDRHDEIEIVLFKMTTWMMKYFPQYFSSEEAPFHRDIDLNNLRLYRGEIDQFVDIAFKGAAKTSRTKLFCAYVILNDQDHFRRYFRVLAEDNTNSGQIATDVYNMLVSPEIRALYPETFAKNGAKREETMTSFTTSTGVKFFADTVRVSQRGALQEDARPDFVWFEDFENRKTLRSAREGKSIWENMEEARTGLAKGGACLYTCNYISEMGNVHTLVSKHAPGKVVLIVPIIRNGKPTWSRYTVAEIDHMRATDEDFEGERLCKPSATKDMMFDRAILDAMPELEPVRTLASFMFFGQYDPTHAYGSGHDVSGGVGIDSSTSVFIDFSTVPARVVGVFHSNTIKPESFGEEIHREGEYFSLPIAGVERNYGAESILRAKQLGVNLYKTEGKMTKVGHTAATEYGWHTNALTKPKMINGLVKAVNDGLLQLSYGPLIAECKSYTRNDLLEEVKDIRLTTRHFDLLTAAAIAWQMKDFATVKPEKRKVRDDEPEEMLYSAIGI